MAGMNISYEFGAAKRRRRDEWDQLVQRNPDLARSPEEYNMGLEQYQKTGKLPTEYEIGTPLRIDTGMKEETPLPGGGASVKFPTTEVYEGSRPIQFGERTGFVNRADPGNVIYPKGGDRADKLVVLNEPYKSTKTNYDEGKEEIRDLGGGVRARYVNGVFRDYVPRVTEGRSGPDANDPQVRYHLGVLDDYRTALSGGKLTEDLQNQAIESANALGLPVGWEEQINEPSFWDELLSFGKAQPETTRTPTIGYGGGGKILVVSPDGEEGYIPAANLQKALQRGYKRK